MNIIKKRPLLVVGKEHGKLLVYMFSSKHYNKKHYKGYKDNGQPSYLILDQVHKLPMSYIFEKRGYMPDGELQTVHKIIQLENNIGHMLPNFQIVQQYQKGDIVKLKNHIYLVRDVYGSDICMAKVHRERTNSKQHCIQGCYDKYYVDVNKSRNYPKSIDLVLHDVVFSSEFIKMKRKLFQQKSGTYSIRYPIGQTLIDNSRHYLYLFTLKGKIYALPFTKDYWELEVVTISNCADYQIDTILDEDEYQDALSQAIDAKVNTYHILKELQQHSMLVN